MARKQGEVRWTGQKEASNARRLWVGEGSLWGPSSPSRPTVYDSPLLDATLDALEPLGELPDRASVHLDRAYDSTATRRRLAARCLVGEISEKGKLAPLKAGKRWVVERTNSWHNAHKKKLVWCTERYGRVIDFWVALSDVVIIVRRHIREG